MLWCRPYHSSARGISATIRWSILEMIRLSCGRGRETATNLSLNLRIASQKQPGQNASTIGVQLKQHPTDAKKSSICEGISVTWPRKFNRTSHRASWRSSGCIAGCKEGDSVRGTRIVKTNESATSWESSGCRPAFDSCVRPVPEIPAVVIDAHGCDFLRRKRDFLVSSDLDDAALAGNNLVEMPAVPEID